MQVLWEMKFYFLTVEFSNEKRHFQEVLFALLLLAVLRLHIVIYLYCKLHLLREDIHLKAAKYDSKLMFFRLMLPPVGHSEECHVSK